MQKKCKTYQLTNTKIREKIYLISKTFRIFASSFCLIAFELRIQKKDLRL